jgi:hypothetical protein
MNAQEFASRLALHKQQVSKLQQSVKELGETNTFNGQETIDMELTELCNWADQQIASLDEFAPLPDITNKEIEEIFADYAGLTDTINSFNV